MIQDVLRWKRRFVGYSPNSAHVLPQYSAIWKLIDFESYWTSRQQSRPFCPQRHYKMVAYHCFCSWFRVPWRLYQFLEDLYLVSSCFWTLIGTDTTFHLILYADNILLVTLDHPITVRGNMSLRHEARETPYKASSLVDLRI